MFIFKMKFTNLQSSPCNVAFLVSIYQLSLAFRPKLIAICFATLTIHNDNEFCNTCSMPYFTRNSSLTLCLFRTYSRVGTEVQSTSTWTQLNAGFKETNRCTAVSTTFKLFPPQDMSQHLSS